MTLVERLRELDPDHGHTYELRAEAADRIEALEAALREIVMLSDMTNISKQYQVRHASAIARGALEEGK